MFHPPCLIGPKPRLEGFQYALGFVVQRFSGLEALVFFFGSGLEMGHFRPLAPRGLGVQGLGFRDEGLGWLRAVW